MEREEMSMKNELVRILKKVSYSELIRMEWDTEETILALSEYAESDRDKLEIEILRAKLETIRKELTRREKESKR